MHRLWSPHTAPVALAEAGTMLHGVHLSHSSRLATSLDVLSPDFKPPLLGCATQHSASLEPGDNQNVSAVLSDALERSSRTSLSLLTHHPICAFSLTV